LKSSFFARVGDYTASSAVTAGALERVDPRGKLYFYVALEIHTDDDWRMAELLMERHVQDAVAR